MQSRRAQNAVIWAIALFFGGLLLSATYEHGAGVTYDSVFYLGTAERMLEGKGYTMPFDHYGRRDVIDDVPLIAWPPLFPAGVAVVKWISGFGIARSAAVFNALMFIAGIALIALTIMRITSGRIIASVFGAVAFGMTSNVLYVYSFAWSEPLFLVFTFTGIFYLARYVEEKQSRDLVVAALSVGLASITRYVGQATIPMLIIGILLLGKNGIRRNLRDSVIFGTISLAPSVLWAIRNRIVTGSGLSRTISDSSTSLRGEHIYRFLSKIIEYALPGMSWDVSLTVKKISILLIFATASVLLIRVLVLRTMEDRSSKSMLVTTQCYLSKRILLVLIASYGLLHTALIFLSIRFFDPIRPDDPRMLVPLAFCMSILIPSGIGFMYRLMRTCNAKYVMVLVITVIFIIPNIDSTANFINFKRPFDRQSKWVFGWLKDYKLSSEIRNLPIESRAYSNFSVPLYYGAGRSVYIIPQEGELYAGIHVIPRVEPNYHQMVYDDFANNRAVLAWYARDSSAAHAPDSILSLYNLVPRIVVDDGIIYYPRGIVEDSNGAIRSESRQVTEPPPLPFEK